MNEMKQVAMPVPEAGEKLTVAGPETAAAATTINNECPALPATEGVQPPAADTAAQAGPQDEGHESVTGFAEGLYTVGDILRLDTEVEWTVDGILPRGGLMILSGECGSGKSYTALDLSLAVARGGADRWLGHFRVMHGPVLYVDSENGMPLIRDRLEKLGALQDDRLRILYRRHINLMNDEHIADLKRNIDTVNPELIVFDSLRRFHRLGENDAAAMALVMDRIDGLHPAAKIVLHHMRKQGGSSGDRLRGSTDLSASVDTHLALTGTKDGVSRFDHAKSRWAQPVAPFEVRWIEDGGRIRFECCEPATVIQVVSKSDRVLEAIRASGSGMSRKQLLGDLKMPENSLDRILKQLGGAGTIVKGRNGREVLYSVTSPASEAEVA